MMDARAANTALKKAIGFTGDDLASNRMGNLSSNQRAELSRGGDNIIYVGIVAATFVILGSLIVVFFVSPFTTPSSNGPPDITRIIISLPILFLPWLLVKPVFNLWRKAREDLREDLDETRVLAVEGYVRRTWTEPEDDRRHYYLFLGSMEFSVNKRVYDAFSDGAHYRLYYLTGTWLPRTKKLLSAERIE